MLWTQMEPPKESFKSGEYSDVPEPGYVGVSWIRCAVGRIRLCWTIGSKAIVPSAVERPVFFLIVIVRLGLCFKNRMLILSLYLLVLPGGWHF